MTSKIVVDLYQVVEYNEAIWNIVSLVIST